MVSAIDLSCSVLSYGMVVAASSSSKITSGRLIPTLLKVSFGSVVGSFENLATGNLLTMCSRTFTISEASENIRFPIELGCSDT